MPPCRPVMHLLYPILSLDVRPGLADVLLPALLPVGGKPAKTWPVAVGSIEQFCNMGCLCSAVHKERGENKSGKRVGPLSKSKSQDIDRRRSASPWQRFEALLRCSVRGLVSDIPRMWKDADVKGEQLVRYAGTPCRIASAIAITRQRGARDAGLRILVDVSHCHCRRGRKWHTFPHLYC